MQHWIEVNIRFTTIICEEKLNHKRRYKWLRAKRGCRRRPRGAQPDSFTIYSWTIRIICYVKVWKYIIAIFSLVLGREFLIRCAILVIESFRNNFLPINVWNDNFNLHADISFEVYSVRFLFPRSKIEFPSTELIKYFDWSSFNAYYYSIVNIYEWAKRTKFLLAVIYGSPRRHLNSYKTFKKI